MVSLVDFVFFGFVIYLALWCRQLPAAREHSKAN